MSLTAIAESLATARSLLGSYEAVAERIGLSAKMLRQFSSIERLGKRVQKLFQERKIESVDAAAHLAMLSVKEQELAARDLISGKIDTIDLRAIVQLRSQDFETDLGEIVDRVVASKSQQEYIAEFIIRGERDYHSILRKCEQYIAKENIIRLEIVGAIGRLVLDKFGKRQLFEVAKRHGCTAKSVIPRVIMG